MSKDNEHYTIVGDLHVMPTNLEKAQEVFSKVEELGNSVIWLGDLLDTKEVIRGKCLNFLIKNFKNSNLKHYVLVGNHDYFNLECESHSLETLKLLDNVVVVDELKYIKDDMYAVPFMSDSDFKKMLQDLPKECRTLFCHQGITGFDYGNGHIAKDECDPDMLPQGISIIAGHFHKYQKKKNVTYLGTPFSHSFGESNQLKYLGKFSTNSHKLALILTDLPSHITVELNSPSQDELESVVKEFCSSNYYRVIVSGTKESLDKLDVSNYSSIKFIFKSQDKFETEDLVEESLSNLEQFKYWAKEIKGLDKSTIKLGEEILAEVTK